ncbi:MAG: hypothetical protein Q8P31_03100 [Bacillota bacterium]|nr:hypothetical protein [Bacillota bacterium]
MGLAVAGARLGLPGAANAVDLERMLPPVIEPDTVLEAGYGVGYAALRVLGVVAACVFVTGCAILFLRRRAERARANRPVQLA